VADPTTTLEFRSRQQWGFSLLELLVTISVAAILIAIAVPSLSMFIQNSREDSQADSLISSLQYARSEAVKEDANVEVCASADGATCSNANNWATGWIVETTVAPITVLQVIPQLTGNNTLTGTFNGAAVSQVVFQPNGFVQAAGGKGVFVNTYFKLCDARGAAYARDVEITGIGAVQASTTPGKTLDTPPQAIACP
jgi:type IV fimbrial biogenesis protein FimT